MSADFGADLFSQATNLGTNPDRPFYESVGGIDRADHYKISLPTAAEIDVALTQLTQDIDLYLMDSTGRTVQSSTNWGNRSESIERNFARGTVTAGFGSTRGVEVFIHV